MNKSKCCNAEARVDEADEGTVCYMCSQCGKPCDVRPSVSSKRDDLDHRYDRYMNAAIRIGGSKPDGRELFFAAWDQSRAEAIEEVLEILKIYSHDLDIAIEVEHITDKIKCLKGAK